jgi:hypothetical protein
MNPETYVRVHEIRRTRLSAADGVSMAIHTDSAEEAELDLTKPVRLGPPPAAVGRSTPLWCFGMVCAGRRGGSWEFTTSEDGEHTFEGIARFFGRRDPSRQRGQPHHLGRSGPVAMPRADDPRPGFCDQIVT